MRGIRFRHRYTGRIETEAVYGERWLRWAYERPEGRLALRWVATRPWFSRWYGWRMSRPASRRRIEPFIRQFGLDASEFADPGSFRSFNDFFSRRLHPGARPVDADPASVVFPADGRHLGFANLGGADAFLVKGQRFDLERFLGDARLASRYEGGAAVFSRLCPVDYHRFHFPVAGVPGSPRLVEGRLWSVNPVALRRNLSLLWQNRRWLCEIDAGPFGRVLMAEIGATNVGSAVFTYVPNRPAEKGAEKGFFRFGGSAVLTLFEAGRVTLAEDLVASAAEGLELYAHVGDVLGRAGDGRVESALPSPAASLR